jgi:hypothetical protein
MVYLTPVNGAPPTVATKYELVHSVGRRLLSDGNSCRNKRELHPLRRLTRRWMPNRGSTSHNKCTWSGITCNSLTSDCNSVTVWWMISFRRISTSFTNTGRRYLGHQTTWYLHEPTILRLLLYRTSVRILVLYQEERTNARARRRRPFLPTPEGKDFRTEEFGDLSSTAWKVFIPVFPVGLLVLYYPAARRP